MSINYLYLVIMFCSPCHGSVNNSFKIEFCREVDRCSSPLKEVCGIRKEGKLFHLKKFKSECELLKFGCEVEKHDEAYGIINIEYCEKATTSDISMGERLTEIGTEKKCGKFFCSKANNDICGIRSYGDGFKVRLFLNECEMKKHNCEKNVSFVVTDRFICDGTKTNHAEEYNRRSVLRNIHLDKTQDSFSDNATQNNPDSTPSSKEANTAENIETTTLEDYISETTLNDTAVDTENGLKDDRTPSEIRKSTHSTNNPETIPDIPVRLEYSVKEFPSSRNPKIPKNVIVVNGDFFTGNGNINDTFNNFFTTTHVFDLPMRSVMPSLPENSRRMMLRIFGPIVVFQPAVIIPDKIQEDVWHSPTINSCFHKCPQHCPDTYAPVCGVAGVIAREPALVFKNHCYMDAAQCKMRWDNASDTAAGSAYIESTFVMCLGDVANSMYRFLPLIRSLQHMGRLKKKGTFYYKFRNMRFFNELMHGEQPRIQG